MEKMRPKKSPNKLFTVSIQSNLLAGEVRRKEVMVSKGKDTNKEAITLKMNIVEGTLNKMIPWIDKNKWFSTSRSPRQFANLYYNIV